MNLGEAIRITRQRAFYTQENFAQKLLYQRLIVGSLTKAAPNIKAMKAIKSFCSAMKISSRMN